MLATWEWGIFVAKKRKECGVLHPCGEKIGRKCIIQKINSQRRKTFIFIILNEIDISTSHKKIIRFNIWIYVYREILVCAAYFATHTIDSSWI